MATPRICSIPDCGKLHFGLGWCDMHYRAATRHGDPLAAKQGKGKVRDFLNNVVLKHSGDECLLWPFPIKTRYPGFVLDGKQIGFHRYLCLTENGPAPTANHEAAHSCGNSHCVNKAHLSWKTHTENVADKLLHGTDMRGEKHFNSKLTADQVSQIRLLNGKTPMREVGRMFGIHYSVIGKIWKGKAWPDGS
jgi:hypothetical protein